MLNGLCKVYPFCSKVLINQLFKISYVIAPMTTTLSVRMEAPCKEDIELALRPPMFEGSCSCTLGSRIQSCQINDLEFSDSLQLTVFDR